MLSIIVPARNEPYLNQTIKGLLENAEGEIEILVSLDGYWSNPIISDDRVIYIHKGKAQGMRAGINSCVAMSKGEYLMKLDAHCLVDKGFDVKLIKDYEDKTVVVPRRYALDVKNWKIEKRKDDKYPIDYMYLDSTLHGVVWKEKNHDLKLKEKMLDETMSNQGSIWFMKKTYFYELELMDEVGYGTFWNEFQEVGLKCWLSGGKVIVNKNTWYAHWHKDEESGRGYSMPSAEQVKGAEQTKKWLTYKLAWEKQTLPLEWLIAHFWPVPGWQECPDVKEEGK